MPWNAGLILGIRISYAEWVNFALILVYNLFVIFYVSKKVYERWGVYMGRKCIHFLCGGVSILLAPYLFNDVFLPVLMCAAMTLLTLFGHLWLGPFKWFQVEGNYADVYFCIMFTLLVGVFWGYNPWIGILACLFMAWGDGITGVVRNIVYKRRTKGAWGNLAMILLCVPLGYALLGLVGAIGGVFASVIEKFEFIDDNISVPIGSAAVMSLLYTPVVRAALMSLI